VISSLILKGPFSTYIQQVANKESQLIKRTKAVQKASDQLKSIQEMVENELADNKHSEYLLKLFIMRDTAKDKDSCQTSETALANTSTSTEQEAVPAVQVENLRSELKAGVDDLTHPDDIDHDSLKLVMDLRAKRDRIEANVKVEETTIVNLTRELSQAKVQRKTQRSLHSDAIKEIQDYSVSIWNKYYPT
jgi:hypothetical protein